MRAPQLYACLLLAVGPVSASESESFGFWPGKGATTAPGFERMYEHPCGEVAYAKVSKLPTAKNGPLQSEIAVELDRRGNVIRRWPMPVDYMPEALRGEELLFAAGDKAFWVRSNGSFTRATTIPSSSVGSPFQCDLTSVFGKSDYAGCSVFIDLVTRKERTLGYQALCT